MKKVLLLLIVSVFIFSGCSFSGKKVENLEERVIPVENQLTKSSFSVVGGGGEEADDGREKKIETDMSLWKVFEDKVAGVSFKYPPNVNMEKGEMYYLSVESKKISTLDGTMGFDRKTALKNKELLRDGKYGEDVDWPLTESKKIKKIGDKNAQEFMVLSRFEICDVVFERKLYFFNNDYQTVITLIIPEKDIIKEASKYFKYNKENCGNDKIWDVDLQKDFWNNLKNGKGSKKAQIWFDSFDGMVETMGLKKIVNNIEKIQGKWQSIKDPKTIIEFKDDIRTNFYDGEKKDEGRFAFYKKYPVTDDMKSEIDGEHLIVEDRGDDTFDYKILKLTDDVLELAYMARGNTLSYKKIK